MSWSSRPDAAHGEIRTEVFDVADMDCPSCVSKIRGRLERLDGVVRVDGSPVARTLDVVRDASRVSSERVLGEIRGLGYDARPRAASASPPARRSVWSGRSARIAYASIALFAVGLLVRTLGVDPVLPGAPFRPVRLSDALLVGAALVGGWNFFPKGVAAARALALDMNFLMTVAIVGAIGVGEYVEGAAIAFLFALAELLEGHAVDRARNSVAALMELAPPRARRIRGDGTEETVDAGELEVGDEVVFRPGERLPVDGIVQEGGSAVDESPLTGESLPVEKAPGSPVYAGTINREGWVRVRVERPADQSTLARIVRMVEEAESRRTRTERFVERFARLYTPAVTIGALLVVLVPVVVLGEPFTPWFVRGLTLLVIACPCALVISTPVAVVSGVTAAARHGVLIKGGRHLEAMGEVRAIALDKTGTLTVGRPAVVQVQPVDDAVLVDVLGRAAAVEARSEHPLARAVVEYAVSAGADADWSVEDFSSTPGRGVRALVGGTEVRVGSAEWLGDAPPPDLATAGRAVIGVTVDGALGAWIALADPVRPEAVEAMRRLRAAGIERVEVLTGDSHGAARVLGRTMGVDGVRARLLPGDKVKVIEELEARYGAVAMVGDGVNDAPALASATVGIAMGAMGSDVALETADVALLGDDLTRLAYLLRVSSRARRVIRQNIAAALLVKAALVLAVPLGWVSLVTAVLVGDMGVSLAVTLNALRLAGVRD